MHFGDLLAIEQLGADRFVVRPPGTGFLFGGLSLAVILRGAAATVEAGKTPMSLHATFLAGGVWEGPHALSIQRTNDSRAFAGRRVEMAAGDRVVVVADVVFHEPDAGEDWQATRAPDVPGPDGLEPYKDKMPVPVLEVRPVSPGSQNTMERLHPLWCRTVEPVEDPVLQACALAFASDYRVFSTPFPAGSGRGDGLLSRTYSHLLSFHRPLAAADWWLFDCDPLSIFGGRYLSQGVAHGADGRLLASFVQHGYIRPAR